jgi:ketosteroid isomerase-like protein
METPMADGALLTELNHDIWHAFRRTYAANDTTAFLALFAPDLIRAGGPAKQVHGFDEYSGQTGAWFTGLAERGERVSIDFRFAERIASDTLASERGVFQITARRPDGEEQVFFGRFHTFSRKADGRWRIAVDYDSDEGATVDEKAFAAGAEIDDVEAFIG